MPINVVCPGCKKRFAVSDKFAGKKGPCPQCKAVIEVPKKQEEEIVIHAPADAGPKDSKGRTVLKPILRSETRFSRIAIAGVVLFVLVVFGVAFSLRVYDGDVPLFIKFLGAVAVAPPLVLAAYEVLRESELEPFRGRDLLIRVSACAAVYVVLWGIYAVLPPLLTIEVSVYSLAFFAIPIIAAGGFAAYASLDLEFMTATMHYTFYLLITVLLRVVAGMAPF